MGISQLLASSDDVIKAASLPSIQHLAPSCKLWASIPGSPEARLPFTADTQQHAHSSASAGIHHGIDVRGVCAVCTP